MKQLVHYMRSKIGMRVLAYIDYFLIIPTVGSRIGRDDCLRASSTIKEVLLVLVIERHEGKVVWSDRATKLEHLGVVWDTKEMYFAVLLGKSGTNKKAGAKISVRS